MAFPYKLAKLVVPQSSTFQELPQETRSQGPNSIKGQGHKVPGTMSQGPDSLKGPFLCMHKLDS